MSEFSTAEGRRLPRASIRRWSTVAIAAGLAAAVAACTPGVSDNKEQGNLPDAPVTIGLGSAPTSLDPFGAVAPPGTYFFHAVYDGLTAFDPTGKLIPGLATSWTQTSPTELTLKLRTSAAFSNGEKVTAAGVKADLEYLIGHTAKPAAVQVATIKTIDAPSDDTVVLHTAAADPLLAAKLTAVPIPAPQAFAANPDSFNSTAIGTGPYTLTSYTSGQNLQLQSATGSWRGVPKQKTIKFLAIPDPATRLAALKSGQVDIAQNIGPDDIASLKSSGYDVQEVRRGQIQQVMFEVASHPDSPLAKPEVRQALNYAIDVPTIIKTVLGGAFSPSTGQVVNQDAVGFNPDVKAYSYDPDRAKQMLAAAGYPNGFSTTVEMTTGAFPNDKQAYDAVVSYLNAVGVKTTVQTIPLAQFVAALRQGPRAEMFIAGLQYIPELDTSKAMSWWLCSAPAAAKRSCDPNLDALMTQANSTTDATARAKLLQQANALWHNDAPAIPLWQLTDIWAIRKGVGGWVQRPDAVLDLDRLVVTANAG